MEQIQKRSKRLLHFEWIKPVEFFSLHCIRLRAGRNAQNIPWRTTGVEFNGLQEAGLSSVVLANKEIQTAQFWEFEVSEKLEAGYAK
jgi:hypothetical protein